MKLNTSLRRWGLIITGAGLVITLVLGWWYNNVAFPPEVAISFYAELLIWAGWGMVAGGLIMLVIDAVLRRTAHRPMEFSKKPAKSLRWWALVVTGAGAAPFLLMWLWIELAERDIGPGMPFIVALLGTAGFYPAVGGLISLIVDTVLRLTGRRF